MESRNGQMDQDAFNPYQTPTSQLLLPKRSAVNRPDISVQRWFISLAVIIIIVSSATIVILWQEGTNLLSVPPGIASLVINSAFLLCWLTHVSLFFSLRSRHWFMQSASLITWLTTVLTIIAVNRIKLSDYDIFIFACIFLASSAIVATLIQAIHLILLTGRKPKSH